MFNWCSHGSLLHFGLQSSRLQPPRSFYSYWSWVFYESRHLAHVLWLTTDRKRIGRDLHGVTSCLFTLIYRNTNLNLQWSEQNCWGVVCCGPMRTWRGLYRQKMGPTGPGRPKTQYSTVTDGLQTLLCNVYGHTSNRGYSWQLDRTTPFQNLLKKRWSDLKECVCVSMCGAAGQDELSCKQDVTDSIVTTAGVCPLTAACQRHETLYLRNHPW